MGIALGAEIHGADFTQPPSPAIVVKLKQALDAHKIICVRSQHLTPAQHVALGRTFGELEVHPFSQRGDLDEVLVLDTHKDNR